MGLKQIKLKCVMLLVCMCACLSIREIKCANNFIRMMQALWSGSLTLALTTVTSVAESWPMTPLKFTMVSNMNTCVNLHEYCLKFNMQHIHCLSSSNNVAQAPPLIWHNYAKINLSYVPTCKHCSGDLRHYYPTVESGV